MVDEAVAPDGLALVQGLLQRVQYQAGVSRTRDTPADDAPGKSVGDKGDIDEASLCRDVGKILSANSGGLSQGGEAGHACLGARRSGQPRHNARDVQRGGGTHLLQPGLGEADVTASAHAESAHAL